MSTDIVTGEDLVPSDVTIHRRDDGSALVPIDEIDVSLASQRECDHVFWVDAGTPDESRLYALEPDPESGMWSCCPNCGLILGQNNLGEIPRELRRI